MSSHQALSILAVLFLSFTVTPSQQWRDLGKVVGTILDEVPEIGVILEQEPLTTSLEDARLDFPLLDEFRPGDAVSLARVGRSSSGAFLLSAGTYRGALERFCLKPGTHGPGGGDGYVYAPPRGPQADIVQTILRNSALHPEISHSQIQGLLWAVVTRAGIDEISTDLHWVASQLLDADQIWRLNAGALGFFPGDLLGTALCDVPGPLRRILGVENLVRSRLRAPDIDYAALERLAILTGTPGFSKGSRKIPQERWSYHPDGYFIRYSPRLFHPAGVEVLVPAPVRVEYDRWRRITALEDSKQRIEVAYDAARRANSNGLEKHTFRSVRLASSDRSGSVREWKPAGGTWTGWSVTSGGEGELGRARRRWHDLETFLEQSADLHGRNVEPLGLVNLAHFTVALDTLPPWAQGYRQLAVRALAFEVCASLGGCTDDPRRLVEFDPSEQIAVPGNTGRQRLGLAARLK